MNNTFDLTIEAEVSINYYPKIPSSLQNIIWQIAKISTKRADGIWVTEQNDLRFIIIKFKDILGHQGFIIREASCEIRARLLGSVGFNGMYN